MSCGSPGGLGPPGGLGAPEQSIPCSGPGRGRMLLGLYCYLRARPAQPVQPHQNNKPTRVELSDLRLLTLSPLCPQPRTLWPRSTNTTTSMKTTTHHCCSSGADARRARARGVDVWALLSPHLRCLPGASGITLMETLCVTTPHIDCPLPGSTHDVRRLLPELQARSNFPPCLVQCGSWRTTAS